MAQFSILDHLDALTIVKDLPGEIHSKCPICGAGGFKISKKTGEYFTFGCGCMDTIEGKRQIITTICPDIPDLKLSDRKHLRPKNFRSFNYRDRLGNNALTVTRTDFGDGRRKQINREPKGVDTELVLPYLSEKLEVAASAPNIPSLFITEGEPKSLAYADLFPQCLSTNGVGGKWSKGLTDYIVNLGFKDVTLCPDRDSVGLKNCVKIHQQFLDHGIVCNWVLPYVDLWQDLPSKDGTDIVDWIIDGATSNDLILWTVLGSELPAWLIELISGTNPQNRWEPPDTLKWLAQITTEKDLWLVPEFLSYGSNMLVGKSGQGKSILATQLAASIATGKDFLGRKVSPGVVLYHTSDEPEKLLKHRLNSQDLQHSDFASNFKPLIKDIEGNRWSINYLDGLESLFKRFKPKLFVVDSLRSAIAQPCNLKETDEEIGILINALKELCEVWQVALLLVHHQRKNSDGDALDSVCGHNSIASPLDVIWSIKPDPSRGKDARKLVLIKNRIGEDLQEIYLTLDTYSLTYHAPKPHNLELLIKPSTPELQESDPPLPRIIPITKTLTIKNRIEDWFKVIQEPKPITALIEYLSAYQVSTNTIRKYLNELVTSGFIEIIPATIPKLYTLKTREKPLQ